MAHSQRGTYLVVFFLLLLLLASTVAVALVDLGPWNTPLALLIAVFKAALVALYFMHLRDAPRLTWAVAAAGIVWLSVLTITMSDYFTRPSAPLPAQSLQRRT